MANRNFPSIFQAWSSIRTHTFSHFVLHDVYWHGLPFGLYWTHTDQDELMSLFEYSQAERDELLAKNPNMLFLGEIRYRDAGLDYYPEDFPYWIRDDNGNPVTGWNNIGGADPALIDFTHPDFQDIVVQQVVAVSKCGLLDGVIFDWWHEDIVSLSDWNDWSKQYSTVEAELEARLNIVRRIREQVPDDFLIIGNTNDREIPITAPYMNGGYMEAGRDHNGDYPRERLLKIESSLVWLDKHLREPRITCLEGWGIGHEPPDSPANKRWMRFFTTQKISHDHPQGKRHKRVAYIRQIQFN